MKIGNKKNLGNKKRLLKMRYSNGLIDYTEVF